MEKVNSGIVFSNDILRILQGKNALDFNYEKSGLVPPTKKQVEILRENFKKDVNRIFENDVTIFSEEEMESFLNDSLDDCLNYPHCFIR